VETRGISVLIAAYNAESFLDLTLTGVQWQTTAAAEVVIVDDCSTDKTYEIAMAWKNRLPIKVIRNEKNLGLGASRNIGLSQISSPLVAVLDADDLWLPSHLEMVAATITHDRQIVSPRAAVWMDRKAVSLDGRYSMDAPRPDRQFKEVCRRNFVFSGALFPLMMVEEVGGYPDARVAEDLVFWLRSISRGFEVVKPAGVSVLYRRHERGLSRIRGDFFRSVADVVKAELTGVEGKHANEIKKLLRRLKSQERLSSHDEHLDAHLSSAWRNLLPVILAGPARLKLSALLRVVRPNFKSPYQ